MRPPLLLLLLLLSAVPAVTADLPPSNKVVFILAGQSNMAGRGGVLADRWDGIVPPDCAPSPSILRLSPQLRWEEAHEPLHAGIDANRTCGVGPGMAFANAVLRSGRAGPVLGLVPCAVGGTRMAQWVKGTALYADLVRRARVALETGGRIGAVLWYQGESDTVRWADATEYGRRMVMLVRDLRADLAMPHLLLIQVGLASGLGQYTEIVREAQKGIKLRNVRFVDAKGLPLQDGHLHLSTQAQVQLGHMLAQSYLNYAWRQATISFPDAVMPNVLIGHLMYSSAGALQGEGFLATGEGRLEPYQASPMASPLYLTMHMNILKMKMEPQLHKPVRPSHEACR